MKQPVKTTASTENTVAGNSIKNWLEDQRPREKLLAKGAQALTDSELLALQLGSGTQDKSAVDLGTELIKVFGDLKNLANASIQELTKVKGIGPAKAITIAAAFELAKRKQLVDFAQQVVIDSPESVANYLRPRMGDLRHEIFYVLYLNNRNKIIHETTISTGGPTGTVVDAKMVFKPALVHLATSIIVSHNHPSGNLQPSQEDKTLTDKLAAAGKLLDVKLLDHIIITATGFFSFVDNGWV